MRTHSRQTSDVSFRRLKKGPSLELAGSVHMPLLGVLLVLFVIGGGYLYSVNQSAVQGYQLRTLEKEIDKLKQENAELKISEADLRSLYRIEASGEDLQMQKLDAVTYLGEDGSTLISALNHSIQNGSLGGSVALR